MTGNHAPPGLIIKHQLNVGQVLIDEEPKIHLQHRECQGKVETAKNVANQAGPQVDVFPFRQLKLFLSLLFLGSRP